MAKAKKKSRKVTAAVPMERYKPSMDIDAGKMRGMTPKVGKSVSVNVKGKVIEERIDRYEGGKKMYRMEIDKISPAKGKTARKK